MQSQNEMKLLSITQLSNAMSLSVSTVRRRVTAARKGKSTFPLPIHGKGKKCLWRADDVLTWNEEAAVVPHIENHAAINPLLEKYNQPINRVHVFGMELSDNAEEK